MAASIRISPSPAVIRVDDHQTTVDVTVKYRPPASDIEPIVWERTNDSRWNRRVIDTFSGEWVKTLKPADLYEVLMYTRTDVDPNVAMFDPEAPVARGRVVAITKRTPTALSEGEEMGAGGTYIRWNPNNPTIRFKAIMDVGINEPVQTNEGVDVIPDAIGFVTSDFATHHILHLGSPIFQPETDYWAALLLIAEDGSWQTKTHRFTTRKRTVNISMEHIHIINDGSAGHNTASFKYWVLNGDRFVGGCVLGNREISDRPSPGEESMEWIPLDLLCSSQTTIESTLHDPLNQRISILTRGIAKDAGILAEDDIAGNFVSSNGFPDSAPFPQDINADAFLSFPVATNPDQPEDMEDASFVSETMNVGGGDHEFQYAIIGSYSVSYI